MRVREFQPGDQAAIVALQRRHSGAAQWSAADYERLAADPRGLLLVAELEAEAGPVVGFAAFHRLLDEAELGNIAVSTGYERQGVGRALVSDGHRRLREAGVKKVYLEVRASNAAARALYIAMGYTLLLTRLGYYSHPTEDAQVMVAVL